LNYALLYFVLLAGAGLNRFSVDTWLFGRRG